MDQNFQSDNTTPQDTLLEKQNIPSFTPPPQKPMSKIFIVIGFFVLLIVGGVSVFAYQTYQKNKIVPVASITPIVNTIVNDMISASTTDVTIKYINVKGKLLSVSNGHYLSSENIYSSNPTLYYDGNSVVNPTMLIKRGYIVDESLSQNGLNYSFVIAHYPHYPMRPQTNTHDLYINGKKIESLHNPILPLVSDIGEKIDANSKTTNTPLFQYSMFSPNGLHTADVKNKKIFIDGKLILPDITIFKINQFQITDSGHYLLFFSYIYPSDKYGDTYKTSVYIDGKEYSSVDFGYGYINNDATHHLFYGSTGWTLDGKPVDFQGDALPYEKISDAPLGVNLVEMKNNTIYVYKTDKTNKIVDKIPEMPANTFNGLDENISIIMDKVEGIGSRNTAIQFKGKVINNSDWKEIYLNGAGGNTSSQELTMDNSQFFVLPPKLDPGQTISGELFSVAVSQVALPGDYNSSANFQGGFTDKVYDLMLTVDVILHIK